MWLQEPFAWFEVRQCRYLSETVFCSPEDCAQLTLIDNFNHTET
jgi:hypothetical protein